MDDKAYKKPHSLILEDRKQITLSGVTDVGAFDEESLTVYTDYGEVTLKGEKIQVNVVNTETGQLTAEGKINSVTYTDKTSKKTGFLSKVFR